jgi:hypothetical protein
MVKLFLDVLLFAHQATRTKSTTVIRTTQIQKLSKTLLRLHIFVISHWLSLCATSLRLSILVMRKDDNTIDDEADNALNAFEVESERYIDYDDSDIDDEADDGSIPSKADSKSPSIMIDNHSMLNDDEANDGIKPSKADSNKSSNITVLSKKSQLYTKLNDDEANIDTKSLEANSDKNLSDPSKYKITNDNEADDGSKPSKADLNKRSKKGKELKKSKDVEANDGSKPSKADLNYHFKIPKKV